MFNGDLQSFPSKRKERAQILRALMALMLLQDLIFMLCSFGASRTFSYLTNWTLTLTLTHITSSFLLDFVANSS